MFNETELNLGHRKRGDSARHGRREEVGVPLSPEAGPLDVAERSLMMSRTTSDSTLKHTLLRNDGADMLADRSGVAACSSGLSCPDGCRSSTSTGVTVEAVADALGGGGGKGRKGPWSALGLVSRPNESR